MGDKAGGSVGPETGGEDARGEVAEPRVCGDAEEEEGIGGLYDSGVGSGIVTGGGEGVMVVG